MKYKRELERIRIPDGLGYREVNLVVELLQAYLNNPKGIHKPLCIIFDVNTGEVNLMANRIEYRINPKGVDLVKVNSSVGTISNDVNNKEVI